MLYMTRYIALAFAGAIFTAASVAVACTSGPALYMSA
jgi:hypothetical protein